MVNTLKFLLYLISMQCALPNFKLPFVMLDSVFGTRGRVIQQL
jgi:hypothetical protein